ncbi:MAG: hypothetical protein AAF797_15075 [Planctomycetota bacterium]
MPEPTDSPSAMPPDTVMQQDLASDATGSEPTPTATPTPAAGGAFGAHRTDIHTLGARRPLLEWTIYAGAMAIGVAILAGPLLGQALTADTSHISAVIGMLFLAAVAKNFLDMRFIARQVALAEAQVRQLQATNNIAAFLKDSEPSLFRDHIANLYEVFRRDVNISQDNLVTLMQTRLLSRTRVVEFASGVLVTLGLVGTIIGLIASAGGLGQVFDAAAQATGSAAGSGGGPGGGDGILEGMRQTLNGMGIAFYTTLMGAILGGVCLRLLSSLVDAAIDHIVSRIAELTEVYILPILRRAARINEEYQKHQRDAALAVGQSIVE